MISKKYLIFSLTLATLTLSSIKYPSPYNFITNNEVHASSNQKVSSWAKPYVDAMRTGGLIPNRLASADLTQNITREEFAELITTYVNKVGAKGGANANISFSDTTNPLVKQASQMGIVDGFPDGTFKPTQQTNREQIATMTLSAEKLVRPNIVVQSNTTMFTDGNKVGKWAKEGVSSMRYDGVIEGYPDKSFKPQNQATREQAIKIVAELAAKKGFITINKSVTKDTPPVSNTTKPADGSIPLNKHGIPENPKPAPQTIAGFTPDIRVGYQTKNPELDSYFKLSFTNARELGTRKDINLKIECVSHPQLNKIRNFGAYNKQWSVLDMVEFNGGPLSASRAYDFYSMPMLTPTVTTDVNGNPIVIKDGETMEYKITMSTSTEKIEIIQYIRFKDKQFNRK